MEAKAKTKVLRISSQKLGLVTELVRYKDIRQATSILETSQTKAAPLILKVLNAAVANATQNHGMSADKLYISQIFSTEGPTMKRFRPRAKGRADQKLKRTSHLTVVVSDDRGEK